MKLYNLKLKTYKKTLHHCDKCGRPATVRIYLKTKWTNIEEKMVDKAWLCEDCADEMLDF